MTLPTRFPEPFRHDHPPILDVYELEERRRTLGQRMADRVAALVGSWRFIIGQTLLLVVWVSLNVAAFAFHWDPYPFILLNLILSVQAAYTSPLIMMSQNREAMKDRLEAHNAYEVNQKAEEEVRAILDHLAAQDGALARLIQQVDELHARAFPGRQTADG